MFLMVHFEGRGGEFWVLETSDPIWNNWKPLCWSSWEVSSEWLTDWLIVCLTADCLHVYVFLSVSQTDFPSGLALWVDKEIIMTGITLISSVLKSQKSYISYIYMYSCCCHLDDCFSCVHASSYLFIYLFICLFEKVVMTFNCNWPSFLFPT